MTSDNITDAYAKVCWRWQDIQGMRPKWNEERCKKWLELNEAQIQSDMIDRGVASIETLLGMENDDDR